MRTSAQKPRVLGASARRLEPSKYYDGPYEAIYLTEGILLTPYGDTQQRRTDLDIWNLWRQIVGNQVVSTYITEFRLYRDDDAEFDAFVEEVAHDEWIFGVNLDGLDLADTYNRDSVIELFVHEYAHILHHYHHDAVADFEEQYWDPPYRGDRYYLSDYAQIDAEEDFAESFAHFVLGPRPHGNSVTDEKVRFFYQFDKFENIRADIRDRLRL